MFFLATSVLVNKGRPRWSIKRYVEIICDAWLLAWSPAQFWTVPANPLPANAVWKSLYEWFFLPSWIELCPVCLCLPHMLVDTVASLGQICRGRAHEDILGKKPSGSGEVWKRRSGTTVPQTLLTCQDGPVRFALSRLTNPFLEEYQSARAQTLRYCKDFFFYNVMGQVYSMDMS